MSTVNASGSALPAGGPVGKPPKSPKQQALEEALAVVQQVAAGNPGAAVLKEIRQQRAAAAQERLGRAQERYELLHKTMVAALRAGDARSATRIAKEAASLARDVGDATRDIARAARDGALGDTDTRRGILDGVQRLARRVVGGVRNLVEAARIANGGSEPGRAQAQRARDIVRARRDVEDSLARLLRDIGAARMTPSSGTGIRIDV